MARKEQKSQISNKKKKGEFKRKHEKTEYQLTRNQWKCKKRKGGVDNVVEKLQ